MSSGPEVAGSAARAEEATRPPRLAGSSRVALGVLTSRLFGLVRESVFAALFGVGAHADVLTVVFRGPMLIQSLLGEQALSASFIPNYCRLVDADRREAAGRLAGAIFGLLLAVAAMATLVGVFFAPAIVSLTAPGFLADAAEVAAGEAAVDRFRLAVPAVRFLLPMGGVLLLSAWSLGVLNSHRRFFLPYVAPVVWNLAIIGSLAGMLLWVVPDAGGLGKLADSWLDRLLMAACIGALGGGLLQFLVQLPTVATVLRGFRLSFSTRVEGVRDTLRAFTPILASRGAVQMSSYLDQVLASLLAAGALAGLRWSALLYMLPLSLSAHAVATAELPELSRVAGDPGATVRKVRRGLRQIAFPAVPAMIGYLTLGFFAVGLVFGRGSFEKVDQWLVYLVLAGYTLGMLPVAWTRLLQTVFYAMGETRTPARYAIGRLTLSAILGLSLMFWFDRVRVNDLVGLDAGSRDLYLGAMGLTVAAGLSAWVELALLRRALRRRLPALALPSRSAARMAGWALVAVLPAAAVAALGAAWPPGLRAAATLLVYAGFYLGVAHRAGWEELEWWVGRLGRRSSHDATPTQHLDREEDA